MRGLGLRGLGLAPRVRPSLADAHPGTLVAVGGANLETQLAWSNDNGSTWESSSLDLGGAARAAAYNPTTGALLVAGDGPTLQRSYGGDVWESLTVPVALTSHLRSLAFGNGRWVVGGSTDAELFYSDDDGDTWTQCSGDAMPTTFNEQIRYVGGYFIAVGNSATSIKVLYSEDGITFASAADVSGAMSPAEVFFRNDTWLIGANEGTIWRTIAETPATGWAVELSGTSGHWIRAFAKFGSNWYGYRNVGNAYHKSTDGGASWGSAQTPVFSAADTPAWGLQWEEDGRLVLGGSLGGITTSEDGETFTDRTSPFDSAIMDFCRLTAA